MKLRKIIKNIDYLADIAIYQGDVYVNPQERDDPWELVFQDSVMDTPWYLLDYYLSPTKDGNGAIRVFIDPDTKRPTINFFVVENKENAGKI